MLADLSESTWNNSKESEPRKITYEHMKTISGPSLSLCMVYILRDHTGQHMHMFYTVEW